jgi:predicted RNase H-like nuclease
MRKQSFQVAGVDGCRAGWFVAIATAAAGDSGRDAPYTYVLEDSFVAAPFAEILSKTCNCELVCVDIPIGLSDGAIPRRCDIEARKLLGRPRASSIFPPPIRFCLAAKDYETASRICFEQSGKKLNKQSFFIMSKIREVDRKMTPELQQRVREIHPELSFWALAGGKPARHNKKTLAGRNERIVLLSPIFSDVQHFVAQARQPNKVGPDDILDAVAAAWTAGQVVIGRAMTLPDSPEFDSRGLKMEILYPAAIMDK